MHQELTNRPVRRSGSLWFKSWRGRWLVAIFAVGLLVSLIVPLLVLRGMMGGSQPMTGATLSSTAVGQAVKIVVLEGGSVTNGELTATLLERRGAASYVKTAKRVSVRMRASASLVMGGRSELQSGAVLQITGRLLDRQTVEASQVVILTRYVSVR